MSPPPPSKRLYLRNLPRYVTHKVLSKHLSSYGKIVEVKMVHDYAFVQFDSQKDAQDVVDTFRKQPFLGHDIIVEFAHPLRKDTPSTRSNNSPETVPNFLPKPRLVPTSFQCRYPIVIHGIPPRIRWQDLKDFGRIPGCLVAYCDIDQRYQGRGFIEYFSQEDADHAVTELDNAYLGGKRVRVSGRPEAFSQHRARSRSPVRRAYSPRLLTCSDGRKPRHSGGSARSDAYDYYRRRSPPPAYRPEPPAPRYHPSIHSPGHQIVPRFSDDRGVSDFQTSYPATGFGHEKYEEQYDYASHSLTLDAWKYDYEYGAGYGADHHNISRE
ncbi:hypothetical protein FPV67DRAFT_408271 [Lyophyllum atratum]|nr:hypothetical protein FPV67DRAFT_408271 [Lyophyllum atratum]